MREGRRRSAYLPAPAEAISEPALQNYLSGRIPEDHDLLIKIAGYFGVTVDFLLTGRSPWEHDAFIAGKKVAEGTIKFETLREIAEADDETLQKVRRIMDIIRGETLEKKKTG